MSEQNGGHAVSAPGLPGGATIIETSLAPKAPVQSAHVTDTAGMQPTQAAAAQWQDVHRAELAAGTSNHVLLRQNREVLAHLSGGPAPEWLAAEQAAAQTESGEQAAQPQSEYPEGFEPLSPDQATVHRTHAVILGVPPAVADELQSFLTDAQLPDIHAGIVRDRVVKHFEGSGGDTTLAPDQVQEYADYAVKSLGGQDKASAHIEKARAYLKATNPKLLERIDGPLANSSLTFDPRIILALSGLHDARGIGAK